MKVRIPIVENHEGFGGYVQEVLISDFCPKCGMPRGKDTIHNVRSYDGGRWVVCDGWTNPCGHIDKYSEVRVEAKNKASNQAM